ncbi:MAG: class I SAM-dependent methyltransferase [Crocosphaera sp.]|nr:class I SAM-dependent methyltransferase [Crocosphaera sp.]
MPSTNLFSKLPSFTRSVEHTCPNCGHQEIQLFYEVKNVPVHSCLMIPTKEEALNFPCGDVNLGFCEKCGFITNVDFDTKWSAYAPNYEDQQSFSPTFNKFALELAKGLIDKYNLHEKNIVEIGCSKGDFLVLLCELGNNYGTGIDPSSVVGRVKSKATERITFIQDYYSEKYANYYGDLICCRHTLEHIYLTAELVKTVRNSIGDRLNTAVFFEIPDMGRVLRELAFEDIYYEHCSYFTPGTLARLFRLCGFEVKDLSLAYGEQYLLIEANPVTTPSQKIHTLEETPEQVAKDVYYFATHIQQKLQQWKDYLSNIQATNKRVVVWGSGSKCVAFLTTLGMTEQIEYIVDINPHRHGKFIPGVGKEIMSPEFLKEYQPDEVVVMNAIYCQEIEEMLQRLGVTTKIIHL